MGDFEKYSNRDKDEKNSNRQYTNSDQDQQQNQHQPIDINFDDSNLEPLNNIESKCSPTSSSPSESQSPVDFCNQDISLYQNLLTLSITLSKQEEKINSLRKELDQLKNQNHALQLENEENKIKIQNKSIEIIEIDNEIKKCHQLFNKKPKRNIFNNKK